MAYLRRAAVDNDKYIDLNDFEHGIGISAACRFLNHRRLEKWPWLNKPRRSMVTQRVHALNILYGPSQRIYIHIIKNPETGNSQ